MLDKIRNMPQTVKASVAYSLCTILQKCLSFITLPLFTRLLTTEQFGQFSIYTSWSAILVIFITLNLPYGSFSTAMVRFEKDRSRYIASIQGVCLMLAAVFLVIYFCFQRFWNNLFELPTELVLLMVAEILANFALSCWYGHKRFEFKYISVVAVTFAISLLSPVLAYFLVINSAERGFARILGYALVTIIFGAVFFVINLVRGRSLVTKAYWKYALSFNIPLIPYYLSQVIFNQSDRIMISHYSGTDKAGIYSVAYSLATVLTFILNAINNSYVPWLYGKLKDGDLGENKKVSNGIAVLMAGLLLCIIFLTPEVILIMAGQDYMEAIWVVPPVAASVLLLFYSQLFINVQFYHEEKQSLVYASIGSALLNIVLNALLIPSCGFVAAAYTTLASYLVFALANYQTMKAGLKKKGLSSDIYDVKGLAGILAVFVGLTAIAMVLFDLLIARCVVVLAGVLVAFKYRKKIVAILKR